MKAERLFAAVAAAEEFTYCRMFCSSEFVAAEIKIVYFSYTRKYSDTLIPKRPSFMTETKYVYCAVRIEPLNLKINFCLLKARIQAALYSNLSRGTDYSALDYCLYCSKIENFLLGLMLSCLFTVGPKCYSQSWMESIFQ
jgi:hypothetical protein